MILTLSNEKIGIPTKPSRWSNEEHDWVTSNYKQDFLQSVAEVNREIQYYNYSMYLCNIPKVDVKGTLEDWKYLLDKWEKLPIYQSNWTQTVADVLNQLVENFNSENFWKTIFSIKHCGSGGQIEVIGWFSKLFREIPRIKYVENFSNHVSIVKYKQINFNKNYKMSVGLFTSKLEDDFMIPDFSFVVHEVC